MSNLCKDWNDIFIQSADIVGVSKFKILLRDAAYAEYRVFYFCFILCFG